jgi:hypothetical protein
MMKHGNPFLQRGLEMALAEHDMEMLMGQGIKLDDWWGADATNELPLAAYECFIDAHKLVVEQIYVVNGDVIGFYAEAAGTASSGEVLVFFLTFPDVAQKLRLLPKWWNKKHEIEITKLATDRSYIFCIYYAMEVSDCRVKWGYMESNLL